MRNLSQLQQLLENCPGHTPLLTDSELDAMVPLAMQGHADCRLTAPLFAEVWIRHWLYVSQWPRSKAFTEMMAKFSSTFHTAFTELAAKPWRHPRAESDPLPPAEPAEAGLAGDELAVWQAFWKRLHDFVCCDGLIAIALLESDGSDPKEAVAVPFRLNGTNEIRDASQQELEEWSKAVAWLREDYYQHSLGADLLGVFPPLPNLGGESVTLAVLLARERGRAVALPEFHPLNMLATGKFRSGRLEFVGGLKAKADLAERIGCHWFLRPENAADKPGALLPGTPLTELLPQIGRWLADSADKLSLARRALAVCRKRLSAEDLILAEASDIFRRLIRIQPALARTPEAESCRKAVCEAAVSIKASLFATVDSQVESLVKTNREKPFHGREPYLITLDQFLNEPGGIMLVTGNGGYGKTALMTQLLSRIPSDRLVFRHFFSYNYNATRTLENFHTHLGLFLAAVLGKNRFESSYDEGDITVLLDELLDEPETHKLVFVLDGLDEAIEILQPHYLRDLPKGCHVIAAARSSNEDQPERYLEPWHELEIKILNLGKLSDNDLEVWLRHPSTPPALQFLSANAAFRKLLHDRAGGEPRFIADVVAYLSKVEDLRDTWQSRLAEVPPKYSDFVRKQYRQLKSTHEFGSAHETLLGLLCAAEGELSTREIQLLLGDMPKLPQECDRWISSYNSTEGDGDKYTLQTLQIRDALREVIPWADQERKLLEHCQTWANHETPYSLRHYATHLKKNWTDIASLVLDARYRAKVAKRLPDEADLPLLVLRSALERAIEVGDWEGTACLMLAHAELGNRMLNYQWRKEDPLEKTAGEAAEVLSHSDLGRAALLRLIKWWTLKWKRQPDSEIEQVRQELSGQKLAMLSGLEADVAAELLSRVFAPDDDRLVHVATRLLDEEARRNLVGLLADSQTRHSFIGARRVLRTFRQSKRREANDQFDKAVTHLVVALAEAERWDEIILLCKELLPRQAALNLLEVGRVAARKQNQTVLTDFLKLMDELVNSCATTMEEFKQGGHKKWKGTPDDSKYCQSLRARLLAIMGVAAKSESEAHQIWKASIHEIDHLQDDPRSRFHALHELVLALLDSADREGFQFIFTGSKNGQGWLLRKYFGQTIQVWEELCRSKEDSFVAAAHALAKLLRLAKEIDSRAPRTAVPSVQQLIIGWRKDLQKRADMLSATERDKLWMRAGSDAIEASRLDIGWALTAARNIEDRQASGRAVAKLVRRLYQDRKGRLADQIGKGDKGLQHSVRLAAGLATLDFNYEQSTEQLLVRCLPRRATYSVEMAVLKAELAVALRRVNPDQSKNLLSEAVKQVNDHKAKPHTLIRYQLNVAEAAWRAGEKHTAKDWLRIATDAAIKEKWRVEKHSEKLLQNYTSQWEDEMLDDDLTQSDYVDIVESLCAVSVIQQRINPDTGNSDPLWKTVLDVAYKIAKDRVPGISSRTGALAEIAETANLLGQTKVALNIFDDMHRFIRDRLSNFGEMKIRREKETCLGELMLGLLKARFLPEAKQLREELLAAGTGSWQRKIQDTTALHAFAWLCVCDYSLAKAWKYLRQIKNVEERSKTARDMAIELARQGRWQKITGVASLIERGELKQKYLHKIIKAVAESKELHEHERKMIYCDLLWACSDTFGSTLPTLAHLVRCNQGIGLSVANALGAMQ